MAQSETPTTEEEATTNYAADAELADLADDARDLVERLDALDEEDVTPAADAALAELRTAVKDVEDTSKEVRKGTVEEELKERVEPGETVCGLRMVESTRKSVSDEEEALRTVEEAGVDREAVQTVHRKTLEEVAEEEGFDVENVINEWTITYFTS